MNPLASAYLNLAELKAMKKLLLAILLFAAPMFAQQKIHHLNWSIDRRGFDTSGIQNMLNQGWTVVDVVYIHDEGPGFRDLIFILNPPTEEQQAEAAKRRKEDFDRRRKEYLEKQGRVEK